MCFLTMVYQLEDLTVKPVFLNDGVSTGGLAVKPVFLNDGVSTRGLTVKPVFLNDGVSTGRFNCEACFS